MAAPLRCRWGVLSCGTDSERFVKDILAASQSKGAYLPIQHTIAAIAGDSSEETTGFFDTHFSGIGPSSSGSSSSLHQDVPTRFETAAELVKSHLIDAVILGSEVDEKYHLIEAALNAKKSVVLIRPLDLTAVEARALCSIARTQKTFFGVLIKESKKDKMSLRFIADEAARCRERAMAESSLYAWEDTASLLEVFEDLRRTGSLPPAQNHSKATSPSAMPLTPAQTPNLDHAETMQNVVEEPESSVSSPNVETPSAVTPTPKKPDPPPSVIVTPVAKIPSDPVTPLITTPIDLAPRRYPRTPAPNPSTAEPDELAAESDADVSHSTMDVAQSAPESRTSSQGSSKGTHGSASSPIVRQDAKQTATLRAQLQELKHMLRQKNAQIAAFEQASQGRVATLPAGPPQQNSVIRLAVGPSSTSKQVESRRASLVPQAPPVKARIPRSSRPLSASSVSTIPMPTSGNSSVNGRPPSAGSIEQPIRRRRDSSLANPLSLTDASNKPRRPSEGRASFLAPTVASENRRLANLSQQANGIASRSVSGASDDGSSEKNSLMSKVIVQLTAELEAARNQSNSSRTQLTVVQRNLASLQRAYDSTKQALEQARTEGDRHATALLRKEKILNETLERARKAESEAKELGRSSREWGARVRQVESELGEVRIQKARADAGYDAVTASLRKTREHWENEVGSLRKQLQDVIQTHRDEARSALSKFEEVEKEWKGREGERKGLEAVLEGLRSEREKARVQVVRIVSDLGSRLEAHEGERLAQEDRVQEVREELGRLLALMRSGETDAEKIRAAVQIKV